MRRHLVFALIAVLCLGLMPAAVLGGDEFRPGAPGLDDPYFPLDGNGGYDVDHYGLDVRYEPAIDMLTGTATIEATATHALSQFNLDFVGLTIDAITVNDRAATWSRDEGELTVQPHRGIRADEEFTAVIRYSGVPETITDEFGMSGFMHTDDGALILGQPHVAATWFPANDHPLDKASFTFRLTVPAGTEAIANGSLVGTRTRGGWSTWTWDAPDPMATYLAGVAIGQFDVRAYREDGIRYWDALDTDLYDEVYGPPNAGELGPRTGIQFVWSQAYDEGGDAGSASYKRLSRVIDVPVGGATMSFWTERETEPGWDFLFVESRTVGADDWTTHEAAPHTSTDVGACPISFNPFLEHYLSLVLVNEGDPTTPDDDEYECRPTGTSGVWNAASGASTDWEQWTVALPNETGAARQVEVSISYASDGVIQGRGVVVDDIVVSTGQGSTSFEEDGNVMDGWVVAPPPAGSQAPNNWIVTDVTGVPPPPPPTPSLGEVADDSLARQPEVVDFLSDIFGPYPFKVAGGIVDDADELGFALETQTRPIYSKWFFSDQISGDLVVVHELAHQWAGDSMTIGRWQDIWLNEGFATYAEWLWLEAQGLDTAQSIFEGIASMPADDPAWTVRTGDPGPEALFDFFGVYLRGGMTLHALRLEVGDKDFFRILREWNRQQGGGHVTTPEFIALAERVSGEQLDSFFDAWLYTPEKPAGLPEATPGPEPAAALLLEALRVRDGETAPSTGPRPFLPSASGFDSSRLRK